MPLPPPLRPARRRTLTPYVWIWVALAGASIAYLALLGTRPDLFASFVPDRADEQELAQNQRNILRAVADIQPIRQTVGELKMDVATLKTGMQANVDRDKIITDRLTIIEVAVSTGKPVARASEKNAPAPPQQNPKPQRIGKTKGQTGADMASSPAPKADEARKVAAAPISKPGMKPDLLNAKQSGTEPLETSSIARPAVATGAKASSTKKTAAVKPTVVKPAPVKKPAAKTSAAATKPAPPPAAGVQLATGPSIAALQLNWSVLSDRNPDALGHLQPRYTVRGKASKPTYDLVAGPLGTTVQAQIVCKVLSDRGHPCKVGTYRGDTLPPPI